MSIFLTETDRVIAQGMTGSEDRKHTVRMLSAGTKAVAGVNPHKTSTTVASDVAPIGPDASEIQAGTVEVSVYDTAAETKEVTGAEMSIIFVPSAFTKDAVVRAVDAGTRLLIVVTEGVPAADTIWIRACTVEHGVQIIGPNCPGVTSPVHSSAGIAPPGITGLDPLGLISKSGTLTYQLIHELSDLGFTICIDIGGDPVVGTTHVDALAAFEADSGTHLVVMIGEIGGDAEEWTAAYIRKHTTKPVVTYVTGFTTLEGRTTGHAGAIVSGSPGIAEAEKIALEAVDIRVGRTPSQTAGTAHELYCQLIGEVSV